MRDWPDELDKYSTMLDLDETGYRKLIGPAKRSPKLRDTATRLLRMRLLREGVNPDDPAFFSLVKELPEGLIRIGRVINGRFEGPVFAIPEETHSDLQHIGVLGMTRYGKSFILLYIARQTMNAGGRCWVMDMEDEYSVLVSENSGPDRLVAINPVHLRINLLQPPTDSMSIKTWLENVCLLLRGQTFLRDGSTNLFNEHMLRLMKNKGTLSGSNEFPSLGEVLAYFRNLRLGGSNVRGKTWLESLINQLTMLYNSFEQTANVTSSDMLQLLANRSVIFRLNGLKGIPLHFLTNFLMVWLSCYMEGN